MPEFHATASWTSPDGTGGFWAGLAVEATDQNAAREAFSDWYDQNGLQEHQDYCASNRCPVEGPHPYSFDHVIGPVDKEEDDTPYQQEVVETVDSGPNPA